MDEKERRTLRRQWMYDLRAALAPEPGSELYKRVQDLVIDAESKVIELDDPEAGERQRRIKPEF